MLSSWSCVKGMFSGTGIFSGAGSFSSSTEMTWRYRSAMSYEVKFELCHEVKHGKPNISTPHTLCSTKKLTVKLEELLCLLPLPHWQQNLLPFLTLSNEHIALQRKTKHLWNRYAKTCKHDLHRYFYKSPFLPLLSTLSYRDYAPWDGSNTHTSSVDLGKMNREIQLAIPPFQKRGDFSWCQRWDVNSSVNYCTEGDTHSPNKKILYLTQFQRIYAFCAVLISTQINVQNSNVKIYSLEWWLISKIIHNDTVLE